MGDSIDRGRALRLLNGLEMGGLAPAEARVLAEDLDPVLVHLIVRFLRAVYPAGERAAGPVLERVVQLTRAYPEIVDKSRRGEADPVTAWFTGQHTFAEFRHRGDALVDLVVQKLDS